MSEDVADKNFRNFFYQATGGKSPFKYQVMLSKRKYDLISIPTGGGKTAAIFLSWLWQRRYTDDEGVRNSTPRRLVYCLPLRTLVEQTRDNIQQWLSNLTKVTDLIDYGKKKVSIVTLMGGEEANDWDIYPEDDIVIIGTQDMLLSRALNRGYAMSRFRWPMQFGLLNNDSRWVFDEVQLMDSGLATSIQLEAFRRQMGTEVQAESIWMSATLRKEWLRTIDFKGEGIETLELDTSDLSDPMSAELQRRMFAPKKLAYAQSTTKDYDKLAEEIISRHITGTKTLVVLNTVGRSLSLYRALDGILKKRDGPAVMLLHSHFRPADRQLKLKRLLDKTSNLIVVSTQVIEAGMDISAVTMFTELAPLASIIQRMGRCNREGNDSRSTVYLIRLPGGQRNSYAPYSESAIREAEERLKGFTEVSPIKMSKLDLKFKHGDVIRRKDIIELFDTTPDLMGRNTDVSRFIRSGNDYLAYVFWRRQPKDFWKGQRKPVVQPNREELCPAPVDEVRQWSEKHHALDFDPLEGEWRKPVAWFPGMVVMLDATEGGYSTLTGWDPSSEASVEDLSAGENALGGYPSDPSSAGGWKLISEHLLEVAQKTRELCEEVGIKTSKEDLVAAARWHDAGKAHPAFQAKMKDKPSQDKLYAKAPKDKWHNQNETYPDKRKYFRHELVSALLILENGLSNDLVAYLAAAHHGKVRLTVRSVPGEWAPKEVEKFALGVWDGDYVPSLTIDGFSVPGTRLNLSVMGFGQSSWRSRTGTLLKRYGPFRLAFYEALLRAADGRASGGLN